MYALAAVHTTPEPGLAASAVIWRHRWLKVQLAPDQCLSLITIKLTCGTLQLPSWHLQALVAFLLIGVENIGVQIEQPFSVLPLELFCSTIKVNVIELLAVQPTSRSCPDFKR